MAKAFADNGNVLSVSTDGAEYHARKFLGIVTQCCNIDDIRQFHSYTIGTVELMDGSSAVNVRKRLFQELNRFGAKEEDVISITTDGARNYRKVGRLMNEKSKKMKAQSDGDPENKTLDRDESDENDEYHIEDVFICVDDEKEEVLAKKFEFETFFNHKLPCASIIDDLAFPTIG